MLFFQFPLCNSCQTGSHSIKTKKSKKYPKAVVFLEKEVVQTPPKPTFSYRSRLVEVIKVFQTGKQPVSNEETL